MRVWATARAVDDRYQGLVPATVPYFVLERNFSYAAAYVLVGLLLALSGLGVAMFHPPAGRDARAEAGRSATAMRLLRRRRVGRLLPRADPRDARAGHLGP